MGVFGWYVICYCLQCNVICYCLQCNVICYCLQCNVICYCLQCNVICHCLKCNIICYCLQCKVICYCLQCNIICYCLQCKVICHCLQCNIICYCLQCKLSQVLQLSMRWKRQNVCLQFDSTSEHGMLLQQLAALCLLDTPCMSPQNGTLKLAVLRLYCRMVTASCGQEFRTAAARMAWMNSTLETNKIGCVCIVSHFQCICFLFFNHQKPSRLEGKLSVVHNVLPYS